jgi:hypothetical protein
MGIASGEMGIASGDMGITSGDMVFSSRNDILEKKWKVFLRADRMEIERFCYSN